MLLILICLSTVTGCALIVLVFITISGFVGLGTRKSNCPGTFSYNHRAAIATVPDF